MDLKGKIVESALTLFLERGCKGVTMDQIAYENGISKRTLYELFSDKSQLLEQSIELMKSQMRAQMAKFESAEINIIEILFILYQNQNSVLLDLKKIFFIELKRYYINLYNKYIENFISIHEEISKQYLIKGQREGLITKEIDIEIVSRIIIELSSVLENMDLLSPRLYSRKEIFKELIIRYIRGISTAKGIALIEHLEAIK